MKVSERILSYAKIQRKTNNPWETKLWRFLRGGRMLGFKFKRQVPIGKYIVDFFCHTKRLVIELDGGHHSTFEYNAADRIKERYLKKENCKVLRFWNNEIDNNIDGVLKKKLKRCY